MNSTHRQALHRAAYWCHELRPLLWVIVSILFALWGQLVAVRVFYRLDGPGLQGIGEPAKTISMVILSIAIVALALTIALQIFSFWYSVPLRYLAWWAARIAGRTWNWLTSGWRLPLVLVLAVGIAWLSRSLLLRRLGPGAHGASLRDDALAAFADLFVASTFWKILVATILIVLVTQVYRASRRVIVVPFTNHAGPQFDPCIAELPARLLNDLRRLIGLYQTVDQPGRPIGVPSLQGNLVAPKASTGDIGEDVRAAVGSDSKLEFGPIKIPIGAIVGVFTRMARGPQLSGSLHREGGMLILLARIDGRIEGSWRVAGAEIPEVKSSAEASAALDTMLSELVYRVFTDLMNVGSARWQSVQSYSEGLRSYRRTLHTRQELQVHMRRARQQFIAAHSEDERFARCYYNLGIVDQVLKKDDAARAAYEAALARDPALSDAAYALAFIYWNRNDYRNALRYCERAIDIDPNDARPWNLRGFVLRRLKEQTLVPNQPIPTDRLWWAEVTQSREIGAALAWRALCRAEASGRSLESVNEVARTCLNDAAVSHAVSDRLASGIRILRQALAVSATPELYLQLAKFLEARPRLAKAALAYRSAIVAQPDIGPRTEYWLSLVVIRTLIAVPVVDRRAGDLGNAAVLAAEGAMRYPTAITGESLAKFQLALKALKVKFRDTHPRMNELRLHLAQVLNVRRALERTDQNDADRIVRLQGLLNRNAHLPPARQFYSWARGALETELGRLYLKGSQWQQAEAHFRTALEKFEKDYPDDLRQDSVRAMLAVSLSQQQNRLDEAVEMARTARIEYSEDPYDWAKLGDVLLAKNDVANALSAWETALVLNPGDTNTYLRVFTAYVRLALMLRDPVRRSDLLRKGIGFAETVADLGDQNTAAWAHYWSARLSSDLGDFETGITHWNLIRHDPSMKCLVSYFLGELYLQWGAYDESFDAFESAVKEAHKEVGRIRLQKNLDHEHALREAVGPFEPWPLAAVICASLQGVAYCYAERDVGFEKALRRVSAARRYARSVRGFDDPDTNWSKLLTALCDDCEGWIIVKYNISAPEIVAEPPANRRMALRMNEARAGFSLDRGIELIRKALERQSFAQFYYHLAIAYEHKLSMVTDTTDRQRWYLLAKMNADHGCQLDLSGEYQDRLKALLVRLKRQPDAQALTYPTDTRGAENQTPPRA